MPEIDAIISKPKKAPPPKAKKEGKFVDNEPLLIAVKHCLSIENSVTEHFRLIDAFNVQPEVDNPKPNMSDADKQRLEIYLMGRPDIADYGFTIPQQWQFANRVLRVKFNAIMGLRLAEKLGFRYGGYKFVGNCKIAKPHEIIKNQTSETTNIELPLAFDTKEVRLNYILQKPNGYNWQITELLINGYPLASSTQEDISDITLEKLINNYCKSSAFKLSCGL